MKKHLKLSSFIVFIALVLFTSCEKNVVTNLSLSFATKSFIIGQADSLIAKVTATGDLTKFPVNWTTTNNQVVTVVNGKITGVSSGTASITAKAGDQTATCEVTVNNEIASVMNNGFLIYFGDAIKTGISNLFGVGIAGPSDTLYIYINAPLSSSTSLPVGNYTVLRSINSLTDLVPFSVIPGELYNGDQSFTWYFGSVKSPIYGGNFNMISLVNGTYTIELNLIDSYGNTIYGGFQGLLNYVDKSANLTAVKHFSKSQIQRIPFK